MPVPKIYRETMAEVSQDPSAAGAIGNIPTRYTVHLYRRQCLPEKPASIDDVSVNGNWAKTLNGDQFELETVDNIHVFTTEGNVELFAEAKDWYMDGTFKVTPRLFYQIYMVHACF